MKKTSFVVAGLTTLLTLSSCGSSGMQILSDSNTVGSTVSGAANTAGSVLSTVGSVLGTAASSQNIGNILTSVIGLDKVTADGLVGSWTYSRPGCAFTSESALAAAGGEVVAATVKEKLSTAYKSVEYRRQHSVHI